MANEIANCAILPLVEATPNNPTLALNGELYLNSSYTTIFYKDSGGTVHEISGGGSVNPTDYQLRSEKNQDSGYVGLTNISRITFPNRTDEENAPINSYMQNSNITTRYYTFPDKSGTVAMLSDINSGIDPNDYQLKSEKNAVNGYCGLGSDYSLQIKSTTGTSTSKIKHTNSVARVYTLPDKTGIVQLEEDLVGEIKYFARATAPAGFLIADGSAKSRSTYSNLFSVIGTLYGDGDGSTTFNLPDLRGVFLRGLDQGRGIDPDRTLGSLQKGTINVFDAGATYVDVTSIRVPGTITTDGPAQDAIGLDYEAGGNVNYADIKTVDIEDTVGTPTTPANTVESGYGVVRPTNIALLACIRY